MALLRSLRRLNRLLIFGGKGRVATCEMVFYRGFDLHCLLRVELHYIVAVSVNVCAFVTNYCLMHAFTLTHIYAHKTRIHTHAHTYINYVYLLYFKSFISLKKIW